MSYRGPGRPKRPPSSDDNGSESEDDTPSEQFRKLSLKSAEKKSTAQRVPVPVPEVDLFYLFQAKDGATKRFPVHAVSWKGEVKTDKTGPRDAWVEVMTSEVSLGPRDAKAQSLHYMHAFTCARLVIDFVITSMKEVDPSFVFRWPWRGPLKIYPYDPTEGKNASFSSGTDGGQLRFGVFKSKARGIVYTVGSWDCVGHETGHAVHRVLNPGADGGAAAEFVASILALLAWMSLDGNCARLLDETKGDLLAPSSATLLDELWGLAEKSECKKVQGQRWCALNWANNKKKLLASSVPEAHEDGNTLLGAFWHSLSWRFRTRTEQVGAPSAVECLQQVSKEFSMLLLVAVRECTDDTLGELALQLRNAALHDLALQGHLTNEFLNRKILKMRAPVRARFNDGDYASDSQRCVRTQAAEGD